MVSFSIKKLPPGLFRYQLLFSDTSDPSVAFQINAVDLLKLSLGELPSAFVRNTSGHIIGDVAGGANEPYFKVRFEGMEFRIPKGIVGPYLPENVPVDKPRIADAKKYPKPSLDRVFPRNRENSSVDDATPSLRKGLH